jgi:hypothetical protein
MATDSWFGVTLEIYRQQSLDEESTDCPHSETRKMSTTTTMGATIHVMLMPSIKKTVPMTRQMQKCRPEVQPRQHLII